MLVGPLVGPQIGPLVGPRDRAGSAANPMSGVTQDATSLIYWPSSGAEWTTAIAALGFGGVPTYAHNCQEASGNLAPAVGVVTLVADNTPTYQGSEAGWTRKFVGGTASGAQFNGNLGDPAATSIMFIAYVALTGGIATADVLGETDNNGPKFQLVSDNTKRIGAGGNIATGVTTTTGSVIPVIVQYDRTTPKTVLYTLDEKIVATYSASATGALLRMVTGRAGGAGNLARYGAFAEFTGAAAEITPTQVKTMLTTLGWSPTFTP